MDYIWVQHWFSLNESKITYFLPKGFCILSTPVMVCTQHSTWRKWKYCVERDQTIWTRIQQFAFSSV